MPEEAGIDDEARRIERDRELEYAREDYRDLMSGLKHLVRGLVEQLAAALEVRDSVAVLYPEYWLASLQRAGEAIAHSLSLIDCVAVPAGYEKVAELHYDWASCVGYLASEVWLYVEARKEGYYDISLDDVFRALNAIDAHSSMSGLHHD